MNARRTRVRAAEELLRLAVAALEEARCRARAYPKGFESRCRLDDGHEGDHEALVDFDRVVMWFSTSGVEVKYRQATPEDD